MMKNRDQKPEGLFKYLFSDYIKIINRYGLSFMYYR